MVQIDLSGKVALITGGSQGLGEQFARTLHRAGAAVAINYFPDPQGANQKRAHALESELGGQTKVYGGDVRDLTMMQGTARQVVADLGRLDILINNAGILRDKTLKNLEAEQWQDVIDTNLTGVFNACKGAVPVMSDGGRIVSLASIAAVVGFFGQSNYAAAKAGVMGLTRVLSRELARRRITVNAVAPGVVLTEMGKSIPEDVRAEMLKNIPLGRLGEPAEIAGAVLFLCSDLASYITGQTLHVNGGWIAP